MTTLQEAALIILIDAIALFLAARLIAWPVRPPASVPARHRAPGAVRWTPTHYVGAHQR